MRILHITSHLNAGGVARYVLLLSQELARRGHEVVIASDGGQWEDQLRQLNAEFWRLPLNTSVEFSPQVLRAIHELKQKSRHHAPNIIHAHTRVSQVVAYQLSRQNRLPYVTTWHGFYRMNWGRRLWPCTGDRTIAISEPVQQHLIHQMKVDPNRIRLITHGVDTEALGQSISAEDKRCLSEKLGLRAGFPVVGTVSRLVPSKGVDQLIRSFLSVRRRVRNAQLMIVGEGLEGDRLKALVRELKCEEAVRFVGTVPHTQPVLSLMDVFVFHPAEQEGFGLALLEAMAAARPIVAVMRGEGATWVLEKSEIGELVEPNNAEALAQAIIRLLEDKPLAAHHAQRAREVVSEHYSLGRMVDQVEAVYREVTA